VLSSDWYGSDRKTPATVDDFKKVNKIIKTIGDKCGCKGMPHLLGFCVPSNKLGKLREPKKINPSGYQNGICSIAIDSASTNEYSGKNVMIHAFNIYPMLPISNYLMFHNIPFSSEQFALNEMVQWVWRSAIRKGENVKIAILSSRMRDIFKTWLSK
jgi:hypothetical protein